ncbi:MAG: ABC transporter ATP-binding protein [candidate division Zixibacteria bacterium SM23_73_2]|nr:MAG: ABC transporter ATP-binding protein [candidate division Zixibacteria bacterium SM23_73_2]
MPEISVKTENLVRNFGSFVAVNQVNIEVYQKEIFGFLGANGAGKTTMIRMLCGLLKPSSGKATVGGLDVYRQSEQIKRSIGYMSQKFSLYEDLTVEENINFYGGIYDLNQKRIQKKRDEIFFSLGMGDYARTLTYDLPLGFKQRLALGCALLHDPRILFLDEPTSGVDPKARRDFWEIIHQTVALGTTIFVTTHFMEEAEYCHRVFIMDAGKIIALDTPTKLKNRYKKKSMQEVFVTLVEKQQEKKTNPMPDSNDKMS